MHVELISSQKNQVRMASCQGQFTSAPDIDVLLGAVLHWGPGLLGLHLQAPNEGDEIDDGNAGEVDVAEEVDEVDEDDVRDCDVGNSEAVEREVVKAGGDNDGVDDSVDDGVDDGAGDKGNEAAADLGKPASADTP